MTFDTQPVSEKTTPNNKHRNWIVYSGNIHWTRDSGFSSKLFKYRELSAGLKGYEIALVCPRTVTSSMSSVTR